VSRAWTFCFYSLKLHTLMGPETGVDAGRRRLRRSRALNFDEAFKSCVYLDFCINMKLENE
jgi:hypothetical protein